MKNFVSIFLLMFIVASAFGQRPGGALSASLSGKPMPATLEEQELPCTFVIDQLMAKHSNPLDAEYAFAWSMDPVDHMIYLQVNACPRSVRAVLIAPDGQHHQHSPRLEVDYRHAFDLYGSPAGTYLLEISTADGHLIQSYSISKQNGTFNN